MGRKTWVRWWRRRKRNPRAPTKRRERTKVKNQLIIWFQTRNYLLTNLQWRRRKKKSQLTRSKQQKKGTGNPKRNPKRPKIRRSELIVMRGLEYTFVKRI